VIELGCFNIDRVRDIDRLPEPLWLCRLRDLYLKLRPFVLFFARPRPRVRARAFTFADLALCARCEVTMALSGNGVMDFDFDGVAGRADFDSCAGRSCKLWPRMAEVRRAGPRADLRRACDDEILVGCEAPRSSVCCTVCVEMGPMTRSERREERWSACSECSRSSRSSLSEMMGLGECDEVDEDTALLELSSLDESELCEIIVFSVSRDVRVMREAM